MICLSCVHDQELRYRPALNLATSCSLYIMMDITYVKALGVEPINLTIVVIRKFAFSICQKGLVHSAARLPEAINATGLISIPPGGELDKDSNFFFSGW